MLLRKIQFNSFAYLLFGQSEAESKGESVIKFGGSSRRSGLVGRSDYGVTDRVKDLNTWTSQHSSDEVSDSFAGTLVCMILLLLVCFCCYRVLTWI